MKKLALLGAALALIFTFCFSLTAVRADDSAKELKILSFNIRLSYGEVGKPTEWKNRKGLVADIMRAGDYDFIGIQEAIITQKPGLNQVEDLKALLPEYGLLTRSRMVSETEGESTPIMWRKDRWEMDEQEHGVFWLTRRTFRSRSRGKTPARVRSFGENSTNWPTGNARAAWFTSLIRTSTT